MAQHLVGAPFFAEFDRRALEIAVILFELAFEARQQRKRVACCSRKPGQNLIVVESPDFLGAGFHDSLAERHLPVSGECDVSVFPYEEDGSATHPIVFFPHVYVGSTIGIRSNVSQGRGIFHWSFGIFHLSLGNEKWQMSNDK